MSRAFVLSIDVGSSSVRAGLYDHHAEPVEGAASHRSHRFTSIEGGGSEANADYLLDLVTSCIDETLAAAPAELPISAVAICTAAGTSRSRINGDRLASGWATAKMLPNARR